MPLHPSTKFPVKQGSSHISLSVSQALWKPVQHSQEAEPSVKARFLFNDGYIFPLYITVAVCIVQYQYL